MTTRPAGDPIPLVDLRAQHAAVAMEVAQGWRSVTQRGAFVLGDEVADFEQAFADFSGVRHCVGVGSGTDALELALRAAGVGAGDEIIVPGNSFVASAFAVVRAGATPVLVDVDARTYLVDVDAVAAALSPRTKAIMAVHLYGQVAPAERLRELASAEDVWLLEDAAQAHGARRHGRPAASFGYAGATSFYPGKNLGAYGDAGAVLTDSAEVARAVRALGNHGSERKYHHPQVGFNSRLDSLQAVVLRAKLRHLASWNAGRVEAAMRYDAMLADLEEVVRPAVLPGNEHVWHLYVVEVPRRDEVFRRLRRSGIEVGIHYPVPIHLQRPFRELGYDEGDLPRTESAACRILSLPLFPEITVEQQARVVEELGRAVRADHAA